MFRNSKCFKSDKTGHIKSICKTAVHLVSGNTTTRNSNPIDFSVYNDHLSLPTNSKSGRKSYSSPEINANLVPFCETNASNLSTSDPNSYVNRFQDFLTHGM